MTIEIILKEGVKKYDMRLLAYCIMPNHFHLILQPKQDGDLQKFMQWLTLTHTRLNIDKSEFIALLPVEAPKDYFDFIQTPLISSELETTRHSVNKCLPYGREEWVDKMVDTYKLDITTRKQGRPRKGT